jgi:type I restriction enzyme S subunit
MADWSEVTLIDAIELQRGFDLPENERVSGLFPIVASTSVVGFHNEARAEGPGVVIGRSGSIGGGQWIDRDYWPLNTTLWVKNFRGNDRRFVYFMLRNIDFARFNAGSGVPTLNRNHLASLVIQLPPLNEQHAIAEVLGGLDDKIESNRRRSLIAMELYQTEIRDMLLKLPDNGLGSLQQLSTFMSRSSERIGDVYAPEFSATVTGLEPRSSRFKKTLSAGNQKNKKIQAGDLVFGFSRRTLSFGVMRDPIGSVSPVYEVFRVHGGLEIAGLIEMQIRDQMHDFMDILKPGAREGQPIEANYLLNKKLVLPYNPVGFIISEQIKNLARVVELSVSENRKLTMLRDTLLPELLSGRLRVKGAESMMLSQ